MKQNIVTFSLFRFEGAAHKWWAFTQMGRSRFLFKNVAGLTFYKMVGSGGGNGFSILPNLNVYGVICAWENEAAANDFFEKNASFQAFLAKSHQYYTIFAETATAHGLWENKSPFVVTTELDNTRLVAVLTRATIKLRYLPYFWKFVPRTSRSIYEQTGRLFSIGIGEVPIVQQATFSLWENPKKMMDYAYKSKYHSEVVQKTRALGWYKEELFARFHPYKSSGAWDGLDLVF
jgi:hypothetical protein